MSCLLSVIHKSLTTFDCITDWRTDRTADKSNQSTTNITRLLQRHAVDHEMFMERQHTSFCNSTVMNSVIFRSINFLSPISRLRYKLKQQLKQKTSSSTPNSYICKWCSVVKFCEGNACVFFCLFSAPFCLWTFNYRITIPVEVVCQYSNSTYGVGIQLSR